MSRIRRSMGFLEVEQHLRDSCEAAQKAVEALPLYDLTPWELRHIGQELRSVETVLGLARLCATVQGGVDFLEEELRTLESQAG